MTAVLSKILLFLAFGGSYYQRVRDGQHVHEVYRNRRDVVIGGYVQRARGDLFAAQCAGQFVVAVPTEKLARRYVETCPDPVAPAAATPVPSSRTFVIDLGYISDGPVRGFSK